MHPTELPVADLLKQCEMRRERRSGPGGQHRNKVETAVVLIHRPSGVKAEASERRSQQENRRVATTRLRINLALEIRQPRLPDTVPSARWRSRCQGGSFRVNVRHDDFAPLLAEALDVIDARQDDVSAAAAVLQVSTSQLVRFLKLEPRAMEQVNRRRTSCGKRRLQ